MDQIRPELTEFEKWVLFQKGTEAPFSGEYWDHFESGHYFCKSCGSLLFASDAKFRSHCGWPSFDDAVEGAVTEVPDADGHRTEILCGHCRAHLGHVFRGEHLNTKNTRYCVNSVCLDFRPFRNEHLKSAIFASGCFWGTEYFFAKMIGVLETKVGYTGGTVPHPSYEEISKGGTGHFEAALIEYDATRVSYEALLKLFFETHDFSQADGQGPDIGSQYRSAIFFSDEDERKIAANVITTLLGMGYAVATQLLPRSAFWIAEPYHQKYYYRHNKSPYCHYLRQIFPKKIEKNVSEKKQSEQV